MNFDEYQEKAALTDQFPDKSTDSALMIPLLGLAGETGTLLAEFKKKVRDKESYEGFRERAEEELGDILWYLSNLASHLKLSLAEIASQNIRKTQERWPIEGQATDTALFYDHEYPISEQLPRILEIRISGVEDSGIARMCTLPDRTNLGDSLTDNAYQDDGYRFHDVMHLAHYAVLGWSPVIRRMLNRKRKSIPAIDEVEDGARAIILEELIVAYVYSNAKERRNYAGIKHLDSEMLSTIKRLVAHLEVKSCRTRDWEASILCGYKIFRHLIQKRKADVRVDMNKKTLEIIR